MDLVVEMFVEMVVEMFVEMVVEMFVEMVVAVGGSMAWQLKQSHYSKSY